MIGIIDDPARRTEISRAVLEALPEWFGIPETREQYIAESAGQQMVAAVEDGRPIGFLCLKQTGEATVELAVMGVLKEHHRRGFGRGLFQMAKQLAAASGYAFMQVKTVKMGMYPEYDATNRFYLSLGFREFEVFPTLWDEGNPCQVYVMSLE
ncbi:MAG: GNAT family N-acetyltransferase [Eubacteriales bacterium]|nr:GNAT family N-acetyltransferase [Eubacteriales bacterium]